MPTTQKKERKMEQNSHLNYFDVPAINHSSLLDYKSKGLSGFWRNTAFNPNKRKDEGSDAFLMGTLLHTLLLEPEKEKDILVYDYGKSVINKKYKEIQEENPDKLIVNPEMMVKATNLIQTLIDSKVWKGVVGDCTIISREEPIYFTFWNMPCKIKPDMLLQRKDGSYLIIDYKSTDDIQRVLKWSETLGYDIESTLYRLGVSIHYNVPIENVDFIFIIQDKTEAKNICPVRYSLAHEDYMVNWIKTTFEILGLYLAEYSQAKDETVFLQPKEGEVLEFITMNREE
jgi:hypothetical protein